MYITKQQDFDNFLKRVKKCDAVAIDTEFLREKTYWPKLCLLQMATIDEYALIDPFSVDVSNLCQIFENEKIVKVFHSPRQDIEILLYKTKVLPYPLFDSQLAASFLGCSNQIGYGNLVSSMLGIKLKKGDTYSDWSIRPLTKSQLSYAKDDVFYLIKLYYKMYDELKKLGRLDWVFEDINGKFLDKKLYKINPDERFWHLKKVTSLNPRQLACAKEIAAWREKTAMKRNIPRRWLLSDDAIVELCRKKPKNLDELLTMRGIKNSLNMSDCRCLLAAVDKALKLKNSELPCLVDSKKPNYKECDFANYEIDSEIDLMCSLLRHRAKENNLAPQVLATNIELNQIAHGAKDNLSVLQGWRKDMVGQELLDLMEGKISLFLHDGKLQINKLN